MTRQLKASPAALSLPARGASRLHSCRISTRHRVHSTTAHAACTQSFPEEFQGIAWQACARHREKFKSVQLVDVMLPATARRELTLPRYIQPEAELRILLGQLRPRLPAQSPPRITSAQALHKVAALAL